MKSQVVLIVTENASYEFGGEAALPLNYFLMLSKKQVEVYLITHSRVRNSLERIKEVNQDHVIYVPDLMLHLYLNKLNGILPSRIASVTTSFMSYFVTQCYAWFLIKKIVKEKKITIIHQPAPVSPKFPSMIYGLGAPVVIGPMNGGMTFPPAFRFMASKAESYLYGVARFSSTICNLLIPGKLFAKMLIVANKRTELSLPKFRLGQVKMLVENGVFAVAEQKKRMDTQSINVLFVGRLVDWKAVDILIDAVNQCENPNIKFHIVGDGVERNSLEQHVKSLGATNIYFHGHVPFENINQYYDEADIFVLSSVRECGGAVVLEAMARGLPVIATNWGGPADYVVRSTGFLINPTSRDFMVEEFRKNILMLANNANLRQKISLAAIAHVRKNYLWEDKVNQLMTIYQTLTQDFVKPHAVEKLD